MRRERTRFVIEAELSDLSHAELCRRYSISHGWIRRYREEVLDGLEDRFHRLYSCQHATSETVVRRILEIRKARGSGAWQIRQKLLDAPDIDDIDGADCRSHPHLGALETSSLTRLRVWRGWREPVPSGLDSPTWSGA